MLDRLGVEHDIKEFESAGHSFLNDAEVGPRALRPLFRVMGIKPDPESAPEAWRRIEDHFATAPVAPQHLNPEYHAILTEAVAAGAVLSPHERPLLRLTWVSGRWA